MAIRPDFKIGDLWVRSVSVSGKQVYTKAGRLFDAVHSRCRKGGATQASQPAYIGCTMSENFKNFQFFAEWCQNQVGYSLEGYALEKDLIGDGTYSETTCLFVPQRVNNLILKSKAIRGKYPIGVSYEKKVGQFRADW